MIDFESFGYGRGEGVEDRFDFVVVGVFCVSLLGLLLLVVLGECCMYGWYG